MLLHTLPFPHYQNGIIKYHSGKELTFTEPIPLNKVGRNQTQMFPRLRLHAPKSRSQIWRREIKQFLRPRIAPHIPEVHTAHITNIYRRDPPKEQAAKKTRNKRYPACLFIEARKPLVKAQDLWTRESLHHASRQSTSPKTRTGGGKEERE